MCSELQLEIITGRVVAEAKSLLGNRLDKVILYGSYARGDYDHESDIDIMVLAHISPAEANHYDKLFVNLTSALGLEHNILISLYVKDSSTFYKWLNVLPYYQNIMKDGVMLSA